MKNTNAIGMLTAVAFAVGMVGINLADGTITVFDQTSDVTIESGMLRGHLEIIQTNAEGNVIKYMQTDNAILSKGENCVALDLFGSPAGGTGATSCPADPGIFTDIALKAASLGAPGQDILTLPTELTADGLARAAGTVTSTTTAAGAAGTNVVRIANTFTYTGGPAQAVAAAGLFNQTAIGGAIFAAKDFPSSVTLQTNDQLTVNWDITISGTELFS